MSDIFGKVIAVILCALLMFLYPLNVAKEENRQIERMYLYQETVRFVDSICNTGIILDRDMKNYLSRIHSMNTLYDVKITEDSHDGRIFELLNQQSEYKLDYSDFIKVVIWDEKGNMVVCYGGSVKADCENGEEN